jgi:hypothetical protein
MDCNVWQRHGRALRKKVDQAGVILAAPLALAVARPRSVEA